MLFALYMYEQNKYTPNLKIIDRNHNSQFIFDFQWVLYGGITIFYSEITRGVQYINFSDN